MAFEGGEAAQDRDHQLEVTRSPALIPQRRRCVRPLLVRQMLSGAATAESLYSLFDGL
jgi:hypothetical protein